MSKQYLSIRALRCATIALFLAAGLEGFRRIILPHRSALSTRMQAIKAALATGCVMFVFEAAKQAFYPKTSIWTSHTITILFAALTAAVVTFAVLKKVEAALHESEERYGLLFDSNPLSMWVFGRKTLKFLAVNEAASRQYGFSRCEFLAMTIADIRPEEDIPDLLEATAKPIHGLQEATIWRHRKKNGAIIDVEIVGHDLLFHGIEAELIAARDVTERKKAEETVQKLASIVEFSEDAILGKSMDGKITSWNRAAEKMYGYTRGEVVGRDLSFLVPPGRQAEIQAIMERVLSGQPIECLETQRLTKTGSAIDVSLSVSPIKDASGHIAGASAIARDITQRKAAEKQVQFLAYYDALTGLPNRTLLQDRLAKALASARRRKDKVALLFLDLDRYKTINDSLGHSVGDLVLKEVAERLKRFAREQDTIARVGGDEFLIVLTAVKDAADAAVAAERLMDAMTVELVIQGRSLSISCSIGISISPEHGRDGEALIKNADAAMYCAKESGYNSFRFFTADMNAEAMERLTLEHSLRLALGREELFLVYQPQMDIATGRIIGLEALLRWQHPELGLVPPDKFIRIAENGGLIMPIGEWVLRTACFQTRKWQDEGLLAVSVAVNVSAVQFRQAGFCELIRRVLHETGLAPQYLELELTESLLLSNADVMFSVLQELRAMGLKLAIDDFGTGYSSLSYLKQFPVGKLKIDRSFIRDVAVNPDDAAITTAIISMAKSLNLKVIAEGVEDEAQMSFLRAHQCDEIQGYYFSKPLGVDRVGDKLRGDHPAAKALAQASGKHA